VGLEPVAHFAHEVHRVVAEGASVIVEHTETWHFETGEKVVNHFVTVHELRDGKIRLWRDYWDLGAMMSQAPKWWIEQIARHTEAEWS
jgi:ketosteroid isomerase-like protein